MFIRRPKIWLAAWYLITRNKKRLYRLFQSQNHCTEKLALIINLVNRTGAHMGGVNPSWNCWRCRIDCPDPPPPSCLTFLICWKSYIYWVLRNNSVNSAAVTLSCDTLVLTASSTLSPFFFLPWERVSWTSFRLLLSQFSNQVPWLSRVAFQLSLEHLWLSLVQPPT